MTYYNPLHDYYFAGKFKRLAPQYQQTVLWLIDRSQSGEARFTLPVMRRELALPSTGACVAKLRFLESIKMINREIRDENNLNIITFIQPYSDRRPK